MDADWVKKSKKLAYLLRHSGLVDANGFCPIPSALQFCDLDKERLQLIVANDSKNRFEIVDDKIRARNGHSGRKEVDPGFMLSVPPMVLYHATTSNVFTLVMAEGLSSRARHYVQLSENANVAIEAATRHDGGEPVLLKIEAFTMYHDGFKFYLSTNGVWNVENVPPQYIESV